MDKRYAIRFSGFWFTRFDVDKCALGSPALALARGLSWDAAFLIAQNLRDQGHEAIVCSSTGLPVITPTAPDPGVQAEVRSAWSLTKQ
jgi:hypothetical protein